LDPCIITAHNIHREGVLQIYFGVIFHKTMHLKQAHITSGAFIHCATSLAVTNTDGSAFGLMILLATVWLWRLSSSKTFFAPTLGLTTNLGLGQSWLVSTSSPEEA